MNFFDINNIFFTALNYPMSYIEFFGTIAGGIAVWFEAKASIWYWPVGIINSVLFFFLFFQVQLYPDMFLYAFFFVTNFIGWWRWTHPKPYEENRKRELKISFMPVKQFILIIAIGCTGTLLFGSLASRLHEWLPSVFSKPSAFPYLDSFVSVMSIITTFLAIQKKIESWILWIIVDVIATCMYFIKGIKFVGIEYIVFCVIAVFGLWNWIREYKSYSHQA